MERIVLGYDGSPAAESALDWVSIRARGDDAAVEVVLVANMFLSDHVEAQRTLERAEQVLEERLPGIPVETILINGTLPAALVDAATGAGLLVLGVDGDHPVRSALHGWLPQRVSAAAAAPTCLVPRGWTPMNGPIAVGLADDGSSDAAVDWAAAEADAQSRELRLVHAWYAPIVTHEEVDTRMSLHDIHTQHRALAAEVAERIRREHPSVMVQVDLTQVNRSVALTAASSFSSLLVIGTHRRGILAGGFLGSVAQDLIGRVSSPICVVAPA
jgi:nucleotide-binding universal stress UspA family protein